MRAHIAIPRALLERVARLVGRRERGELVVAAIAEKRARERLAQAARGTVGSLADRQIAGGESSASAAEWVAASRRADDERLTALWGQD